MNRIEASELIRNQDGSIYHLALQPWQIADDIILVGDPGRVAEISGRFDKIDHKVINREFITHTGILNHKRLSVISTGIGTDNIDIVINELDALVNIDLETRQKKKTHHQLNIIRLGTSGALNATLEVDQFIISKYGMGIDNLAHFYALDSMLLDEEATAAFLAHSHWSKKLSAPYFVKGSDILDRLFSDLIQRGITVTAPGFYGPQGRQLRIPMAIKNQNNRLASFSWKGYPVTNYEMETSALYALGQQLGHNTLTICAIIANREAGKYSKDHKQAVRRLIDEVLKTIADK